MTAPLVYVDPFLGAGAVWLRLLGLHLVPPVSWMGGKRRLANRILRLLGLEPGHPLEAVLGDASWWGWVWPLCLDPVTGPQVCAWLRRWQGEDPRALWFRLRDAGPPEDLVERAAGLLWLQARAASGVPVWWEGEDVVSMDGHGRGPYRAWQATGRPKLLQHAGSQIDQAGQTRATEPRLLAGPRSTGEAEDGRLSGQCAGSEMRLLASDGRGVPREAGHKSDKPDARKGVGGMQFPATIADRLDATRSRLVKASGAEPAALFFHGDALDLVRAVAPQLGDRARIYLDPPYHGATGYPKECPRERVLLIADESARHGGRVVLSEAEGLAQDLGRGWREIQIGGKRKPEWVTVYGGRGAMVQVGLVEPRRRAGGRS